MEKQKTQNSQHNVEGRTKLEDWCYPSSRIAVKLQYSRQCGIGKELTGRSVEQKRENKKQTHVNITPSVNPIINYRPWVIITCHYGFILGKKIYTILVSAAENGEGYISICEGNGYVGNPDHSHIWYFVWGHSKIRLTGIVNWNAHIGISMQHELPQNMSSFLDSHTSSTFLGFQE